MMGHLDEDELYRFLEAEVTESRRREIDAHLQGCAPCAARLEGVRGLFRAISDRDPAIDAIDLAPAIREAIVAEAAQRAPGSARARWAGLAIAASVLLGFLITGLSAQHTEFADEDDGIRAKSGAVADDPSRWAGVGVTAIRGDGTSEALGKTMSADDALAFDYVNGGERPFTHLLIFGLDASGELRWFHPAYVDAESDPEALSIQRGRARVVLPEKIRHPLAKGPLWIYGLFAREAHRVSEVERAMARYRGVKASPDRAPPVEISGAPWVHAQRVEVE